MFADGFYSMNWAGGPEPVHSVQPLRPTEEEKVARFGALVVNAGRYEIVGNVLTVHPTFALVPEYVGGLGEFEFEVRGDTLDLLWRRIESVGGVSDPLIDAGVRFAYTWIRQ